MNPDLDAAPCLFGFLFGWSRCLLCGFWMFLGIFGGVQVFFQVFLFWCFF